NRTYAPSGARRDPLYVSDASADPAGRARHVPDLRDGARATDTHRRGGAWRASLGPSPLLDFGDAFRSARGNRHAAASSQSASLEWRSVGLAGGRDRAV